MRRSLALAAVAVVGVAAGLTAALLQGPSPGQARAASHREAPLIALDPGADITDFFMFRSYGDADNDGAVDASAADKVVLAMDLMSEEPSSGPNYWRFDPNVTHRFSIDNDGDGKAEDIVFEVKFADEPVRGVIGDLGLFLSYVALPNGIDTLDHPGIGLRQTYAVRMIKDGKATTLGSGLIVVPSNVGPRTMPNYSALATQGVYSLGDGISVFAGQRDDPFYIDLGAVFDTLNLRSPGTDMLSGFNVHTIALEVPISLLTRDGQGAADTDFPRLGAYASTERPRVTVDGKAKGPETVQVQRLANPLVNEAIIGTEDKDRWNAAEPEDEAAFEEYYANLRLATALEAVFGADAEPLLNVRDLLLKYSPSDTRLSELLRLDVSVAPTPLGSQKRLAVLDAAPDGAGWPNGRRPIDDVTDIAVKVIGGTNYLGAGDGVDANDVPYPDDFPFVGTPHDGRNRVHDNP